MERNTLFWGETPPFPPQKKPASAAKPISACLYKTLTLMLYNLINHPNLMGAHCSCGQLFIQPSQLNNLNILFTEFGSIVSPMNSGQNQKPYLIAVDLNSPIANGTSFLICSNKID
jgi:hypothetical protein